MAFLDTLLPNPEYHPSNAVLSLCCLLWSFQLKVWSDSGSGVLCHVYAAPAEMHHYPEINALWNYKSGFLSHCDLLVPSTLRAGAPAKSYGSIAEVEWRQILERMANHQTQQQSLRKRSRGGESFDDSSKILRRKTADATDDTDAMMEETSLKPLADEPQPAFLQQDHSPESFERDPHAAQLAFALDSGIAVSCHPCETQEVRKAKLMFFSYTKKRSTAAMPKSLPVRIEISLCSTTQALPFASYASPFSSNAI